MSEQDLPALREAAAVASRGHNLVFIAPPSPAWAAPLLKATVARLASAPTGPVLALAPAASIHEWARLAARVAQAGGSSAKVAAAATPGRLARLLQSDPVTLAVTAPETAHELVRRSTLKLETLSALLLLWPEQWDGDEPIVALLQDLPRETQRILVSSDAAATAELAERYCWRAPVVDVMGPPEPLPAASIRSTPVSWRGRLDALGDLVEQLDPEPLAVWTADASDHAAIAATLSARGAAATLGSEPPGKGSLTIAYDFPAPAGLAELVARGEVVLLVPPGTEPYAARIAPGRRPIHTTGAAERVRADLEQTRRLIATAAGQGATPAAYQVLAPLLERFEATTVAAVLYELWDAARQVKPEPAPVGQRAAPGPKLWVGVGKRDDATPNDLVALLVKELRVPREAVGRVEMRETFALVELNGVADPDELAERLTGKTIRKRRLVARVDRGRKPRRD